MVRTILIALSLCAASAAAYVLTPTKYLADQTTPVELDQIVPEHFGEWRLDETLPVVVTDPSRLEFINRIYNSNITRTYVNKTGDRVMLAIAYGKDQSESMQVHTPEFCYPAQGFAVTPSREGQFDLGDKKQPVVQLEATRQGRIEPISYWVVMGHHVVNGGPGDRRNVRFMYGFEGLIPDGTFFRVSSIGNDVAGAHALQERFVRDLFTSVSSTTKSRLTGTDVY